MVHARIKSTLMFEINGHAVDLSLAMFMIKANVVVVMQFQQLLVTLIVVVLNEQKDD